MKIKVKDVMDKIKLTVNHRELMLIKHALQCISPRIELMEDINKITWDALEYDNLEQLVDDKLNMIGKVEEVQGTINPY